jgi:ADP-ribose pyrophosphatase YjhB (NUDIX family)
MHWIQRHILKTFATKEKCRYKDLKPEDVDGNLFMYHLNILKKDGYINKEGSTYFLTKDGKRKVGGMSLSSGERTEQPRVFVMIYIRNKNNILMYDWNRQPYIGHTSLPFSRVRYSQTLAEAALDTLKYKTNLSGKLESRGSVNVVIKKNSSVSTHYIAHIYELRNFKGDIFADGLTGKPRWVKESEIKNQDLVDGTEDIIKALKIKSSDNEDFILTL